MNQTSSDNTITVYYENKPAYNILIEKDFGRLIEAVKGLQMEGRRFMIVTDTNVGSFYLDECIKIFRPVAKRVTSYVFDAGETSKNLDTVNNCYSRLIESGFDRNDILVALGGGVVGDLTGFAAATYLRGIRFIQLPTSLLSMVDSSIGGKTGVDYQSYKNMVGAFYQPKLVYMNLSVLQTLKNAEFNSGMSEIIKHGLIKDAGYYQWLKENINEIKTKNQDVLKEMIMRSCLIKKAVVEEDPKEAGERALLNFGHTIGHSVEKLKELTLLHGECVAVGMACAAYISMKRKLINHEEYDDILKTIVNFEQPITVSGLSADKIYQVTRLDKKMDSDKIRFILIKEIGHAVIDPTVSQEEMLEAIHAVLR